MPAINTVDHSPHPSLQPISNTFCFFFSTKIIKTKTIFGSNSFFLLPVTASSSDTTPNLVTKFKGDIVEAVDGVCFLHRAVFVILDCQWLTKPKTMMALKMSDTQKTLISLPSPSHKEQKKGQFIIDLAAFLRDSLIEYQEWTSEQLITSLAGFLNGYERVSRLTGCFRVRNASNCIFPLMEQRCLKNTVVPRYIAHIAALSCPPNKINSTLTAHFN